MSSARTERDKTIIAEVEQYILDGEGVIPDAYAFYKKVDKYGLPFGGGWADQPAEFMRDLDAVQVAVDNVAYIHAVNAKQKQQNAPPITGGRQYG